MKPEIHKIENFTARSFPVCVICHTSARRLLTHDTSPQDPYMFDSEFPGGWDMNNIQTLKMPEYVLLRLKHILELVPVSRSTFLEGIRTNRFPKPFKNGRCTFWRVEDIRMLIEQMTGGDAK